MDAFARDDLATLVEKREGPCVSIFLPTHRAAAKSQEDRIRFKNLLRQAEERLLAGGMRSSAAREFLAPGQELLNESLFWQGQSDGLAVFLGERMVRHYRLPLAFAELLVASDRFHVRPLLPLASGDGRFYVLGISQKEVRLLRGTRHSVSAVDLDSLPRSLADALKYDQLEKQLQYHTGAPERGARRAAMFHGQGVGIDDNKDRLLRYFRQIDGALHELVQNQRAPLVLAGVEYYFPIYREANTYPHLLDAGIPGNPEGLRAEELHAPAWRIVEPYFQRALEDARAQYRQLAGTGRTSNNVTEIVPAAYHGRVESLFVAVGTHEWGRFNPNGEGVQVHPQADPGDDDLLDLAVIQTLLNRGAVYAVEWDKVPDSAPLAAVFRY